MEIVIMFIVFLILTIGSFALFFHFVRKEDKRKKELNDMLEEHKKNKEK